MVTYSDIRLPLDAGWRGSDLEPYGGDDGARLGGHLHHHRPGPQGGACAVCTRAGVCNATAGVQVHDQAGGDVHLARLHAGQRPAAPGHQQIRVRGTYTVQYLHIYNSTYLPNLPRATSTPAP